jgi:hypothetical protein
VCLRRLRCLPINDKAIVLASPRRYCRLLPIKPLLGYLFSGGSPPPCLIWNLQQMAFLTRCGSAQIPTSQASFPAASTYSGNLMARHFPEPAIVLRRRILLSLFIGSRVATVSIRDIGNRTLCQSQNSVSIIPTRRQ